MVLLCLAAGMVRAQETERTFPAHEIGVSYGIGSNTLFVEVLADVIGAIFGSSAQDTRLVGPVGAEYFYNVSRMVGLGGVGTFTHCYSNQYRKEEKTGSRAINSYSLMPAVKLNWLRRDSWGLYSKLAAGASYVSVGYDDPSEDPDGSVIFNFQASLLGVEVGRGLRGFMEAGWGEQGLLLFGLRYRL